MKSDKGLLEMLGGILTPRILLTLGLGLVVLVLAGFFAAQEGVAVEQRDELTEICSSVGGVGRCRVMTTTDSNGEIVAVAILCDGAESVEVRDRLCKLISSLYGIGYNRISILKISE